MTMDGVTPQAKMPSQRRQRFLAWKNIPDGKHKEIFLANDKYQPEVADIFDECKIKPGVKFMLKLS